MRLKFLIPAYAMFILFASCNNTTSKTENFDENSARKEITQRVNDLFGWALNKDFNLLYSCIANDSNYLSVRPGNGIVNGFNEFKESGKIWASEHFKATGYDVRDLKITFSQSHDVAWFYCIVDDFYEWKGQKGAWENTRWTGVVERRNGRWIIVQNHFSFEAKG